ncbi:proline dehydrogenase family protein [Nocardia terpenica]|uniref:proline dehydrogenase n=1 Tax=Nocardia terpenica TaxID=455432 RepID=A0A291RH82_9NOCA|nr:proline dehydrogenase family protein [Nocardia terpenica]ATL66943.1 proline dehydrogenase [Nocardia terpenica]MBF6064470.1 proline dehydrogenase family protein [Nocardia terpenica]MBF6106906.1 proline dehydrogenase family protein [Nocardia terpenica]MBF6114438.1 proline dehydrogenase family protein [Nocardia terpenica]MBF6121476.1 proline dehydrogenase family protein [Nocardia terpenica]
MSTPVLTNPLRPALLAAARSPRAERGITRMPVTRRIVDRFVAGESREAALRAVRDLVRDNRFVTIDYLGEDTVDPAQADATVREYSAMIQALAQLPTPADDPGVPSTHGPGMLLAGTSPRPLEVSVKLSAFGQALPNDGHAVALRNARTVVEAAAAAGVWVTFDMEDHTTTDSTLSIVRELRRDHPETVGTVLQAYLRRTEDDCRAFADEGARIRLCKGAYNEPEAVAFRRKRDVDASYLRCLRILMQGKGYPMVATHDPAMIEAAALLATSVHRGRDDFEFQMLYGIRPAEQQRLTALGQHLRVYVPFGDQWYGYFVRRLAERPANLMFFLRSAAPGK